LIRTLWEGLKGKHMKNIMVLQNGCHNQDWLSWLLSNSIDCKSLHKVKWDFKRVSNLIQIINDYSVENEHDLKE
jgi:hypothetical protein